MEEFDEFDKFADTQFDDERNDDVDNLKTCWINELCAPEILMYQEQLVEGLKEQIENQQQRLDDDRDNMAADSFILNLHQMELDRISYVLRSYLRCRIFKMENFALYLVMHDEEMTKLSSAERVYVQEFVDLVGDHFNKSFLNSLPNEKLKDLKEQSGEVNMVKEPNLGERVVIKTKHDIGQVYMGDEENGENIQLEKGDQVILPYRSVRALLHERLVDLL